MRSRGRPINRIVRNKTVQVTRLKVNNSAGLVRTYYIVDETNTPLALDGTDNFLVYQEGTIG